MRGISYRKGAVSIFVVVFTALLITIVTVSFIRLMVRDQQRASDSDLSKSAYDSAVAGVEDAKRALTHYYSLDPSVRSGYDLTDCNAMTQLLPGIAASDEVAVRVGGADAALNQAYTCVQVHTMTDDYDRSVMADETVLVPLKTSAPFGEVKIQWFAETDLAEGETITLPTGAGSPLDRNWPQGRPPVIETQLIQTGSAFRLSQFDAMNGSQSNTNTLFLYPKGGPIGSAAHLSFAQDGRRVPGTALSDASCTADFTERYLCSATITVPDPIDGSPASRSNAYLRVTPRYKGSQVRVTLYNSSGDLVQFDGVQPRVDSTGRANDLFRRVSVRVESGMSAVYPAAAIDISQSLCKTFSVTDRAEDYDRGACTP